AGSMQFVYLHIVIFAVWMLFVERSPWPTLTLIVSLEAIFLSTFVMIGQNRQAAFQQKKADHDFVAQEMELKTNTDLTRAIHKMTQDIHAIVSAQPTRHGAGYSRRPFGQQPTAARDAVAGSAPAPDRASIAKRQRCRYAA